LNVEGNLERASPSHRPLRPLSDDRKTSKQQVHRAHHRVARRPALIAMRAVCRAFSIAAAISLVICRSLNAVQPSPLRSGRLTIGKTLTGSIKPLLGRAKTPFFRKLSKFLNRVSASRLRTSHSIPRKLCDYAKLH
jgi:hypothetical protein